MMTRLSFIFALTFISQAFAQDGLSNFMYKFSQSKVTYNRDGSVTFKKLRAHNGTEIFPVRYDTDRDFFMACQMMGFDHYLPEPGLNLVVNNNNFKLMFNKAGRLEEIPVSEGQEISKLTCYRKERVRSSVHAKVNVTDEGTTIFSDIYFLRGDLKFRIANDESIEDEENFHRICRLLDKKEASTSEDSVNVIIKKVGDRVILDESPQFRSVKTSLRYISQVECLN